MLVNGPHNPRSAPRSPIGVSDVPDKSPAPDGFVILRGRERVRAARLRGAIVADVLADNGIVASVMALRIKKTITAAQRRHLALMCELAREKRQARRFAKAAARVHLLERVEVAVPRGVA